ncbi:metallophosphoesterase [Aerococcaceae bacterium zg-ZJ1578]|uniref:YfcE family phosphodiesterase n=1 Tax=Aerococcaceae bacterium zg-252 TaxID=2796928 RepID=UPI001A275C33|nr:metallophosphoesterase [Aerococcaceae bacterium zg-1578]
MKWLVISDNHGNWAQLNQLIEQYRSQVDIIVHCGDSEFPADDPIWEQVDVVVSGNMDFDPQYFAVRTKDTEVGKILVVHGHRHGVNTNNQELLEMALGTNAKFVFHGHTHRLYAEQKEGVVFVNPGSLNHSRGPIPYKTYAVIDIDEQKIIVKFYTDTHECLVDLTQEFLR